MLASVAAHALAAATIGGIVYGELLVSPPAARTAGIELDYLVEIVVDASGRVVSARPFNRAGYGLDEAALRAIADYRFSPALRAGRPVRVRMHWMVQFRLR